jgi:hypothetical protein
VPFRDNFPSPAGVVGYFEGADHNWGSIKNPVVESSFVKAHANVGKARCRAWKAVQQSFLRRSDILPLASPSIEWFAKGVKITPTGQYVYPIQFALKAH